MWILWIVKHRLNIFFINNKQNRCNNTLMQHTNYIKWYRTPAIESDNNTSSNKLFGMFCLNGNGFAVSSIHLAFGNWRWNFYDALIFGVADNRISCSVVLVYLYLTFVWWMDLYLHVFAFESMTSFFLRTPDSFNSKWTVKNPWLQFK